MRIEHSIDTSRVPPVKVNNRQVKFLDRRTMELRVKSKYVPWREEKTRSREYKRWVIHEVKESRLNIKCK